MPSALDDCLAPACSGDSPLVRRHLRMTTVRMFETIGVYFEKEVPMPLEQQHSLNTQPKPSGQLANPSQHISEKYLIAFVIQGDDVFKITADNIIHTTGTADGPAFDAIAKLKAAAALLELTNRHKERPDEIKKMARELAGEGMKMMALASSSIRATPPPAAAPEEIEIAVERQARETIAMETNFEEAHPLSGPRAVPVVSPVQAQAARVQVPPSSEAPVPPPRPQDRSVDDFFNAEGNSRIALISS